MGSEGPDDTLKLPLAGDALLADLAVIAKKDGFEDLQGSAQRVLAKLREQPGQGSSPMHKGRKVTIGLRGFRTGAGNLLEGVGVTPDIAVVYRADELRRGRDAMIEAAAEAVLAAASAPDGTDAGRGLAGPLAR